MKKDWLIGAVIGLVSTLVLAACAWLETPFTEALEYKLYDIRAKAASVGEALSDQVMLVAIDDSSIAQAGRWPWPRALQGDLIRRVAEGGPKVIGVNIFWLEQDSNAGMDVLSKVKESFQEILTTRSASLKAIAADRRHKALAEDLMNFAGVFDEASEALNQDSQLADVLSVTPRVALPLLFSENRPLAEEGDEMLARMPYRIAAAEGASGGAPQAYTPALPLEAFASDVSGMGFSNVVPDVDGAVRAQPVAFQYRGQYFPALPVEMARLARGLDLDAVKLEPGRALVLGDKRIPLDEESRLLIRYAGLFSTDAGIHKVSAVDVLTDKVDPKAFKDKIVFIAPRATGVDTTFVTPAGSITPSADVQLNALQNLLGDKFIQRPEWARLAELGSLLLVGLIVTLLLPFLRAKGGALVAVSLLVAIAGGGWYLFLAKGWWLKIFYPAALLVVDYTAVTLRRFFFTEKRKELVEAEGIETNKALGLQFQQQGMLDMALEKFRRCPVDDAMKEILYNLGSDFERKRQFGKAQSVYEHIAAVDPGYKDLKSKISTAKQASETMIAGPGLGRRSEGGAISTGGSVKPTLGKYEIQKELGRGAMGIVYLGRDPKINRMVAIKTLKFDEELDADSMKDIKERFFREAESAGTLNHPNIVKIFDADEDKTAEVAYIAMELLDGDDLKKNAEKANLLPSETVIEYVAVIADALDYAHEHGVVHRDIKPANIMKLKDGSLRVTDFGIARITASSKTATGTVLGTPSYMSPEQVAGRKVDGRADLFSLGVMLYEMLSGFKPFEGDSIATLLFKIASEPHPDPMVKAGERVSAAAKAVIDRALEKDPEKRYQRGSDMARDLRAALKASGALPAPTPAAPKPSAPAAASPSSAPLSVDKTDPSLKVPPTAPKSAPAPEATMPNLSAVPPKPAAPAPMSIDKTDPSLKVPPAAPKPAAAMDATMPNFSPVPPKPAAPAPLSLDKTDPSLKVPAGVPKPPAAPSDATMPNLPPVAPKPPAAAMPPTPVAPRPPAPPPAAPPPQRPPLVLPSMDDLGFEIVKMPAPTAPAAPAAPKPPVPAAPKAPAPPPAFEIILPPDTTSPPPAKPAASPPPPVPQPAVTFEIERPVLPPSSAAPKAAPARPSDETTRLGETVRLGDTAKFDLPPAKGQNPDGTQKI